MFKWVPCGGPSPEAIERMRARFPKPSEPMGEAWFQSEGRYLYTWLAETPLSEVSAKALCDILWDISGTSSFGRMEEWDAWFKYLLPDLVLRGHESDIHDVLVETTVTAFMLIFPSRLGEVYEGFREDALATLGACLMKPEFWDGCEGGAVEEEAACPTADFLAWQNEEGEVGLADWHAGCAPGPMSASLFFCLKYLNEDEVGPWFESVVAIEDPYFRAALAVWLLGALDLLESEEARPRAMEKSNPQVRWHNSFRLESAYETRALPNYVRESLYDLRDFLPSATRAALVRAVRRLVTPEVLIAWADDFSEDPLLYENLYHVPDLLFDRFTKRGSG
jgi:hypothetical protein